MNRTVLSVLVIASAAAAAVLLITSPVRLQPAERPAAAAPPPSPASARVTAHALEDSAALDDAPVAPGAATLLSLRPSLVATSVSSSDTGSPTFTDVTTW